MNMNECLKSGMLYLVEVVDKHGKVVDSELTPNLVPVEGLNHMLNTEFKGGAQVAAWYLGVFEANYTPIGSVTAATLPAAALECTAYDEATRVAWTAGTVSAGALDNSASRAEFTFNAIKTIYGGFLSSQPTKGTTLGSLGSVVRFSSPKSMDVGSVLRITAGFTLSSS